VLLGEAQGSRSPPEKFFNRLKEGNSNLNQKKEHSSGWGGGGVAGNDDWKRVGALSWKKYATIYIFHGEGLVRTSAAEQAGSYPAGQEGKKNALTPGGDSLSSLIKKEVHRSGYQKRVKLKKKHDEGKKDRIAVISQKKGVGHG